MQAGPPHAVRCLKVDDGRSSVWLVQGPEELPRTVKLWRATWPLLVKLVLRIAQPQRQMRGARLLGQAGVRTPEVVGSWGLSRIADTRYVRLEMRYIEGRSAYEVLAEAGDGHAAARRSARPVGQALAAIVDGGLFHRDLKLRNVIVQESGDPPAVWIIDPVGVRQMNDRPMAFLRMLDRLIVEAVEEGMALPRAVWQPALRAAISAESRVVRRVVCGLLREHLRQRYGPPSTASQSDQR